MIKSWIFEFFATPAALADRFDPAASQRYFNAYLDLWASAEPIGFDGIFFSEHHFGASLRPSPNLLIAQMSRCAPKKSGLAFWAWCCPIIRHGSWSKRSACWTI